MQQAKTIKTAGAPVQGRRPSKIRPSKMGKWRAIVLIGVHVLIGLHIAHWLLSGETITPVEPSEAMAFGQRSVINAGLIFFAATILLTAVFGRFFCGWGCHVLALQDFCRALMLKIGITPRPLKSRLLAWVPVLAFVYMFLWPAIYRLWIGDDMAIREVEMTTSHFWSTFPGWIVGGLTFLVCGFACVYFLGAKGFCTYACPYGAIFAGVDRIAPLRIRVTDACEGCGHCTAVCSSNVRVHEEVRDFGMVVSPGCMKCMDCVSVCPKDALYYGAGPIALLAKPRVLAPPERVGKPRPPALKWTDEALLALVFAGCFVIVRGLYGVVPFLMSLGVAGVMAFLALTSLRLLRESTVERAGLRLKRDGALLPQGKLFVVVVAVLAVFFVHSAVLQRQSWRGDHGFNRSAALRQAVLETPVLQPELDSEQRDELESSIEGLRRVQAWGLFSTLGNAAKLAWLQALTGPPGASEQAAIAAIERGELVEQMHQLRARNALLDGNSSAAVEQWRLAITARPDLPEAYLALGLHLAQRGEIIEAQAVFDEGAAAVGHSAQLFYNAGLARALSGQMEASVPLFEKALALNPRYLEARENLAGVLASLGDFEASVTHYRAALEQSPDDAQTRLLLARALIGLDRHSDAMHELERVLVRDATNVEARTLLDELRTSALR